MKTKITLALIAMCLMLLIGVGTLYSNDYRIIKNADGSTKIGKSVDLNEVATKATGSQWITLQDGKDIYRWSYNDADITCEVLGVKTSLFTQDLTSMTLTYSLSANSPLITTINDDREEYSDGILTFDDNYNLIIDGGSAGTKIDTLMLYHDINEEINKQNDPTIDLSTYYIEEEETELHKTMMSSINTFNTFKISYTDGFDLTANILAKRKLINVNEDGTISVDITESTARDICGKNLVGYNSIGEYMTFIDHNGNERKVKSETYGNYIDYTEEAKYLVDAISNWKSESDRIPIMKQEAKFDLDSTRVEVDKNEQHAYYYKDGELKWDSDVVTGLPTKKRETPTGIYFIINKVKDTPLVGESWNVNVDRWLGVTYKGVGFHDARWRSHFGGSIYKSNGSHGCINTPKDKMYELWDLVEVGTPVIMY